MLAHWHSGAPLRTPHGWECHGELTPFFHAAQVEGNDEYPVQVVIKDEASGAVLFQTAQRNLFRKYPDARTASIKQIEDSLRKFYKLQ